MAGNAVTKTFQNINNTTHMNSNSSARHLAVAKDSESHAKSWHCCVNQYRHCCAAIV